MRLDPLFDAVWTYDDMQSLEPSRDREGLLFGQGTGILRGRLSGRATWANNPRLRGGFAYPDARGAIQAEPEGLVLFSLTGVSSLTDGRGIHVMRFTTDHEQLLWLNTTLAVGEGSIDPEAGVLHMRYYACAVDFLPDLPDQSRGKLRQDV